MASPLLQASLLHQLLHLTGPSLSLHQYGALYSQSVEDWLISLLIQSLIIIVSLVITLHFTIVINIDFFTKRLNHHLIIGPLELPTPVCTNIILLYDDSEH